MKGGAGGGCLLMQEHGRPEECSRCDDCSQSEEENDGWKRSTETVCADTQSRQRMKPGDSDLLLHL